MQPIRSRLEALETKARGDGAFRVVIMQKDETEQQALQRYGIHDETADIVFIMRFGPMTECFDNTRKRNSL